jgi:hypothetical protein
MDLDNFKRLPIWKVMETKAGAEGNTLVLRHADYILPLMEGFVNTFPTYTLHNREHIYNVIRIMGDLLAERVDQLSGLEAMILILSAIYHDYGMVYSEDERAKITGYEDFNLEFLQSIPAARLMFERGDKKVSKELAEWYCRWAHARRVWRKLDETEAICGLLEFTKVPFRIQLGNVCESHNEPVENIRVDDKRFDPAFLGECDLRFCALLLRLADILDFDNSRSPQSVYDFLDLANPKNYSEQISKDEWNKHMASHGFRFEKKANSNPLLFIAIPPHPYIEQGILSFLNLIDSELAGALRVTGLCSDKWKLFPFPEKIDRSQIKSSNYLSGKFRFTLSEDKILDLLTGDDLYGDDFVFIREILQNAIDTVRHRVFIEKISNAEYQAKPIMVTFFQDNQGFFWFRVDDEGMGMDMNIIKSHLLNKGNSYYNSDLFKLEKLTIKEKIKDDFTPISRFGIGLLSCFMTCDKIEINTCYAYPHKGKLEKNRMSIEGRSGFMIVQSENEHHKPEKMPSQGGLETGYRQNPGTSIACRIKTSREFYGLSIKDQLDRYLLAPEIPVMFEGKAVGGDRDVLVNKPWCKYSLTALPDEFVAKCSTLLNINIESIAIEVLPIDITKDSGTDKLTGQMVLVIPRIKANGLSSYYNLGDNFRISEKNFRCYKKIKDGNGREVETEENYPINDIIDSINIPEDLYPPFLQHGSFQYPRISHNGIVVHDDDHRLVLHLKKFDHFKEHFPRHQSIYLSTGLFCFKDSLLPDVVVSRNIVRKFGEEIVANVLYATRSLLEYNQVDNSYFNYFSDLDSSFSEDNNYSTGLFDRTKLYERDPDFWNNLPCAYTKGGLVSINELKAAISKEKVEFSAINFESKFYHYFSRYLIQRNFDISYIFNKEGYHLQGTPRNISEGIAENLSFFRPMKYISCIDESKVSLTATSFNLNHRLMRWFLANATLINKEYHYLGAQVGHIILNGNDSIKNRIVAVNDILNRFRTILPEGLRPTEDLDLTEDDFVKE